MKKPLKNHHINPNPDLRYAFGTTEEREMNFHEMFGNEINQILNSSTPSSNKEIPKTNESAKQTQLQNCSPLNATVEFVKRFVFLPTESLYLLIALWIMATHLYKSFEYMGYLFIHSPEPQSGKSRLLEVLNSLVWNSRGVTVYPTSAVLFRTAHDSTQLLDEVDSWTNGDELRSVLNAGFKRDARITRMDHNNKTGYKPQTFEVYCPRAFAGIGEGILHGATRTRTFIIRMERQTKTERRERFRGKHLHNEVVRLKNEISSWAKHHAAAIQKIYEADKFPYLEKFEDRTIDISQPLAAILEVAQSEEATDRVPELLAAISHTRSEQKTATKAHLILTELLSLATKSGGELIGNATELSQKCSGMADAPTDPEMSAALRQYGFKTKSVRLGNDDPKKRYCLSEQELKVVVERYVIGAEEPASEAIKEKAAEQTL